MDDKTKEELRHEIDLYKALCTEREISDEKYAIKLVEKIVFAACALALTAVVAALIGLVVMK